MKALRLLGLMGLFSMGLLGNKGTGLEDINRNIMLNQNKLEETTLEKTKLSNHLTSLGNAINQKYQQSQELSQQIQALQRSIEKNQAQNLLQEKSLEQHRSLLNSLKKDRHQIQDAVTSVLLKDLLFVLILEQESSANPEDLILQEIFKHVNQDSKIKLADLNLKEEQINSKITQITQSINQINKTIGVQKDRQHNLEIMVSEQQKLIATMRAELAIYNKKLTALDKERKELDQLLASLNIIKRNKEKELEREQQNKQKAPRAIGGIQAPLEVRQVANSYRDIVTIAYNGPKTIAPLANYKIVQKFGPYFDPVYKLKVFNEYITLVSTKPNAVVRSIFDGRVVYAKEVPILKKVIIIEHKGGMHTIYSQLDKIAPTIKHGLRVQKGYVIGRIDQRLSFEVTIKDKHIDPLEIIAQTH
ncbi:murein hydrolase activator EnvC family protein [Helicobacter mehlei]|uniref:Peptidoglycan DD-metalloendopeptidase family protein n=1 Tax=Helicobacter mehlei TaxID=2316080 RepID=A0A553UZD7_9HELI|nr:peptidoglycan DD-metalloendopeptidase family protein [Helicobacter mehlei]TSA85583.1 peptidoglycan DD-metalloendopeptidase family protein [Helicobacter mehlei]